MTRTVTVNGVEVDVAEILKDASVLHVEHGVCSVLWKGRSYEVRALGGVVHVNGQPFEVEVRDPREFNGSAARGAAGGRQQLTAPMPGKVIRVLVEEGQEVEAAQGILVVEAMKMQNEMQSAKAGRVVSLRVRAGSAVSAGDVLAVIE